MDCIGAIIKERYCIIEKLAAGGQGSLYLARDLELSNLWAVKCIPIEQNEEAKILRKLTHYGIPRMIDYYEDQEQCYLIMEYIEGESLGQMLRRNKKFTISEILDIEEKVAEILRYLHENFPPIIYGDLKPDNIMLSKDGGIYLVDMGSAYAADGREPDVCRGTKAFAAPEQFQGQMSPKSDIYSYGKNLSFLLKSLGRKKYFYYLFYPQLFFIRNRCTKRNPDRRFSSFEKILKQLQNLSLKIHDRKRTAANIIFTVLLMLTILVSVLSLIFNQPSFENQLQSVTQLYYNSFTLYSKDEWKVKKTACLAVDEKLKKLLTKTQEEKKQQMILMLLARNARIMEEIELAGQYYCQLLLYYPNFGDAYGEYGLMLLKEERWEEAGRIFTTYLKLKKKGIITGDENHNTIIWINKMKNGEKKY